MDLHQNARLTFRSREALAKKVMMDRLALNGGLGVIYQDVVPNGEARLMGGA